LSAMRYALELLPREAAPPVGPSRTVLQRQLAHLTRLVDDLLDLSRVVSNRIQLRSERVDLLAVVRDTVATVQGDAAAKSHRLTVSAPETPLWTTGDAVRLTQVVANLLTNAVRYTPPGGHIRVTLEPEDGGAAIVVADTGVGLERDDLPRVFQMFTQVGEPGQGGLGIGLALVKEIVDLHGGRVHAQSGGPGCGAEFTVWLPLAVAADAHADRESPRQSAPPPRRILVVDDNVDAADMLKALLEFDGHDVSVAHDGTGALRCAQQAAHDIGLFDVGLPDMSGYELAQALRRDPATERMFLIAVTGWGQPEDREKAFAHGFHAHLTKPATPDAIREQVRAAAARLAGGEQAHRS
ncbi:MAG TPA: ATP-binding protein, partial [Vicinamibacterales bacterium]